jgi:membrane protein YdbS with pleckstrin-like domain
MSRRIEEASRWMYRGIWRGLVNWFRVPDEPPTLPVRPGEYINSFQPAEGFLRYLTLIFFLVAGAIDLALLIGYVIAAIALFIEGYWWIALLLAPVTLIIMIVPDILPYIAIHLRYDTTWYVMTDRSLRIRRGIWVIHETTITFENVQNLKVQQGPLQRHFGIANLVVETAGAGGNPHQKGAGGVSNKGIIEGVSNAEELRERILARMRQSRSAGLGDESHDDHAPAAPTWTAAHLDALRGIRDELRLIARSA